MDQGCVETLLEPSSGWNYTDTGIKTTDLKHKDDCVMGFGRFLWTFLLRWRKTKWVFGETKTMSDWVADFADAMNAGGHSEITEVEDDFSVNDTTASPPYGSEEICYPTSFDYEGMRSPRTHRNPDKTSDMKKPSKKRNWKKKIANCISKIGLRGKGSSSAKHEESPSLAEFDADAIVSEVDELSQLFRKSTSDLDKIARPQSWRKVLMCTSMRVPDEDKFTADRSLQDYVESWN